MAMIRALASRWKLTALVLGCTILALLLITLKTQRRLQTSWLESAVISVIMPLQQFLDKTIRETHNAWNDYFNLVQVRQENLRLQRQISELQGQLHLYREAYLQQQRLRDLLGLRSLAPANTVVAEVIGIDPSQWSEAMIINKGQKDGIAKDYAVITHQGLVGRTLEVAPHYTIVLLLTDRRSVVDAIVQRTRARGIVVGKSRRLCELRYVDSEADIRAGDTIISSGLGEVYPKGLRIGIVVSVLQKPYGLFYEVEVQPSADLAELEEVLVVVP